VSDDEDQSLSDSSGKLYFAMFMVALLVNAGFFVFWLFCLGIVMIHNVKKLVDRVKSFRESKRPSQMIYVNGERIDNSTQ